MQYKLTTNSANADSIDFINIYFSLNSKRVDERSFLSFKIIDSSISDHNISFLFFFVIVELKDSTTHQNRLYNNKVTLHPGENSLVIDFYSTILSISSLHSIAKINKYDLEKQEIIEVILNEQFSE